MAERSGSITGDRDLSAYDPAPQEEIGGGFMDILNMSKTSVAYRQAQGVAIAKLRAPRTGRDILSETQIAIEELTAGLDPDQALEEEKQRYVDLEKSQMSKFISDNFSTRDPSVRNTVVDYITQADRIARDRADDLATADGAHKIIAELYSTESATDFKKRQMSVAGYAMQKVRDFSEERGTFETAYDWITLLVGLDTAKDAGDLMDRGEFFDMDGLMESIRTYQELDPEEQVEAFEVLFPKIVKHYDYNHKKIEQVVGAMHSLRGPESIALDVAIESLAGIALDLPDILKFGAKLGSKGLARFSKKDIVSEDDMRASSQVSLPTEVASAKAVADQKNEAHKLVELGNDEAAAQAATISGLNPEASKLLGMTALDAASTANPFRLGDLPIINSVVDGISDLMRNLNRQSVEQVIALKTREINNTRKGITHAQRRAAERTASEAPREIDRLRREILVMEDALKRGKTDIVGKRKSMPMSQSTRNVLESQIAVNAGRIQGLMQSLDGATSVLSAANRITNLNAEIMALKSGFVPNSMADAVREAMQAKMTVRTAAQTRMRDLKDAEKAHVAAIAERTSEGVAELSVRGATASLAARVLDDPLSYGLKEEYAENLRVLLSQPINDLSAELERLAPNILTPQRKEVVKQEVIDRIIREAEDAEQNIRVADIVDMDDGGGFTAVFRRDGKTERLEYKFTYNDVGVFDGVSTLLDKRPSVLSKLFSPETLFKEFGNFVNDFTFAGDQAAKAANRLMELNKGIRKGLNSNQRAELDELLIAGDQHGRVFSYDELRAGLVETEFTIKAHEPQVIDAYYKTRVMLDELHSMRESVIRKELVQSSHKELTYKDAKGVEQKAIVQDIENFRGQDVTDQEAIWMPVGLAAGNKQYTNFAAVKKNIAQWKEEGYKLVKLMQPHEFKTGTKVRYALVEEAGQSTRLGELPTRVLNYQPGYIPRIYRGSYHFVKDLSDPAKPSTWFAAETREEATKLRDSLSAFTSKENLVVASDRELSTLERMALDADSYGGLYTGARKQNNLMVRRTDGTIGVPERVSSGQAINRYIANISSIIPLGEYRMGVLNQWKNTVELLAKKSGFKGLDDPTDLRSDLKLPEHQQFMMKQALDYIDRQLGMPSAEEKLFAMKLKQMSDALYPADKSGKLGAKFARDSIIGMMDRDPVQQIKGYAFNAQMGWFNIRQFVVQAQNTVIAAAVSPKNAPAAIADALAMRIAILSNDEKTWRQAAKLSGKDQDEFVKAVTMFRESGLLDSIKRTADFDANVVTKGSATFAGLRKAAEAGRVFFTEGELFSRLVSFNIARRNLGPNAGVREIFDEHLRLSMNMQSANAAMWQKNWWGIPTQYMQVFAKFYERVIPALVYGKQKGGWSRAEAARVLGMQVGMYGTVGIPGSMAAYNYLAEAFDTDPSEIKRNHAWIAETYDEGALGAFAHALGIENNFSPSLSLVSGTFDNIATDVIHAIYDGATGNQSDTDIYNILTGPSGSAIARTLDAAGGMVTAANVLATDFSLELMGKEFLSTMDDFLAVTSGWSNARKAMLLHDVGLMSKRGNTLIGQDKFEELNMQTFLGRAMGFETDIEKEYWQLKDINRTSQKYQKEDIAALKKAWTMFQTTGDLKRYKAHEAAILEGKTPGERIKLMQTIHKGLTGQDDFDRQAKFFLRDFISSGGRVPIHPAMNNAEVQ